MSVFVQEHPFDWCGRAALLAAFRAGVDTATLAARTGKDESFVYNAVARAREEERP